MRSNRELLAIRKKLSHMAMKWEPSEWLATGIPELNEVMGHAQLGLPFGRMIEVTGWESNGKSAVVLAIAGLAQRAGAHVIWGDVENSFEPDWARQRGLLRCEICKGKLPARLTCKFCGYDPNLKGSTGCGLDESRLTLIQPYVGMFGTEKVPRLSTAQELCVEIEESMQFRRKTNKSIVVIDSIAALLTEIEGKAGISGSNLSTKMDLPSFMGRLLRRWVGLAQVHNAMIILINQLRSGPAKYGDPTYAPGGNAPRFYSHVRVRIKRVPNSKIIHAGKTIGIKGTVRAVKNKTGGVEGAEYGFRLLYKGALEFVPVKDVKSE